MLFALLDHVLGVPPTGIVNPTIDLRLRLVTAPHAGRIEFDAETLRLGRTLYVAKAELRHEEGDAPFGVGTATFMNRPLPYPDRTGGGGEAAGSGPLRGATRLARGVLEVAADLGGPQGTASGATLGRLAELAALDLLSGDGRATVDDLDARFIRKARSGPLHARATLLAGRGGAATVQVAITDAGVGDVLLTHCVLACSIEQRGV